MYCLSRDPELATLVAAIAFKILYKTNDVKTECDRLKQIPELILQSEKDATDMQTRLSSVLSVHLVIRSVSSHPQLECRMTVSRSAIVGGFVQMKRLGAGSKMASYAVGISYINSSSFYKTVLDFFFK